VTACGRGGTGGGGGRVSALFDFDDESNVIDRDLRNVIDSLRRRDPTDVGGATGEAGAGTGDDDGDLVRGGRVNFGGCEGGKGCGVCRGTVFGRDGDDEGDDRNLARGCDLSLLCSDPVSPSSVADSNSLLDS
jgi:hypothetical protein